MNRSDDPDKERDHDTHSKLRESDQRFIRPMLTHANMKEASKLVEDHAGQNFDRSYAAEQEQLRRECERGDEQAKAIQEELRALQQQRRVTKSHITVAANQGTDGKQRRSFSQWSLKDQLTLCNSLFFMALVLCAGAGNVFSAIMAESIPVFLEHPYLALLLSCLLPAGSVALHSFAELLGSDRSKERYTKFISLLTFVSLVIWAVTFGMNYQIGDDAFALETLSAPTDHTSMAFTIVQLLAEMLCGTALALIATQIQYRYTKDITIPNPEAETLDECIAQISARYNSDLTSQRVWGRLVQLKAMRALYVSEQAAKFLAVRRRFDDSNPEI